MNTQPAAKSELTISVVLPAKNEAVSIGNVVTKIRDHHPEAEIIVVNDGSTDDTATLAEQAGAKVVTHVYSRGNGAAIKSGARAATGELIVFMDGDGQHRPEDIQTLLDKVGEGYDLVVGSRTRTSQATVSRWLGNSLYSRLASWIVGHQIDDLTSGFRAVRAEKFLRILNLLPNGFSYPTTSTMAFFRMGFSVGFVPIDVQQRQDSGGSHIKLFRDAAKFLLIIFRIATLYSPLRVFVPISSVFFIAGLSYYSFTFITESRFTNMSMLLFTTSIIIFLIGLVSEQITQLVYVFNSGQDNRKQDKPVD